MSRRSKIREHERQKLRHRKLKAPVSLISGQTATAFQTPTTSDLKRIPTAVLFKELQKRPEVSALLSAIAESKQP
jgi:hypothetical protein